MPALSQVDDQAFFHAMLCSCVKMLSSLMGEYFGIFL